MEQSNDTTKDLIGRATLLVCTMTHAELNSMIERQEAQIYQSMPPKRSEGATVAMRAYKQSYGDQPNKRVCPPHLRGKEVGHSYHDAEAYNTHRRKFITGFDAEFGIGELQCRLSPEAIADIRKTNSVGVVTGRSTHKGRSIEDCTAHFPYGSIHAYTPITGRTRADQPNQGAVPETKNYCFETPSPVEGSKPDFNNVLNIRGSKEEDFTNAMNFRDSSGRAWSEAYRVEPAYSAECRHPFVDKGCLLSTDEMIKARLLWGRSLGDEGWSRYLPPFTRTPPQSSQPKRDVQIIVDALSAGRSLSEAIDIGAVAVKYQETQKYKPFTTAARFWLTAMPQKEIDWWLGRDPGKTAEDCKMKGPTPPFRGTPIFPEATSTQKATAKRIVSSDEFANTCQAIWTELDYQNKLPIRTADEAKDTAGFATLARAYLAELETHWAKKPGQVQPEGNVAVPECLDDLRKLAAIFARAMIYCGIRPRNSTTPYVPSGNV